MRVHLINITWEPKVWTCKALWKSHVLLKHDVHKQKQSLKGKMFRMKNGICKNAYVHILFTKIRISYMHISLYDLLFMVMWTLRRRHNACRLRVQTVHEHMCSMMFVKCQWHGTLNRGTGMLSMEGPSSWSQTWSSSVHPMFRMREFSLSVSAMLFPCIKAPCGKKGHSSVHFCAWLPVSICDGLKSAAALNEKLSARDYACAQCM